jgi:diguanylate cyclase (GGDEF)-like protein
MARAERNPRGVAVLFIDLDRFKEINDALGHDAGDEVLVFVAASINSALRASDTVARLGGDEFVVVCEDVDDIADVTRLAERVVAGISRPLVVRGHTVSLSASIGIAIAGPATTSGDELIRAADIAMFRAKRQADRSYVIADDEMITRAENGLLQTPSLLAELRHAIQADLLQLYYQPVVRVDGRLIGLEALVRWPHPQLGLLLPQDFLPRVAGTDLARSLSDWVLRSAVLDAASWNDPRVRVSVNMFVQDVARPGFADTVAMLLTWAGLPSRGLYLELHEPDLSEGGPALADELDRLRRLGVGLAIDDVGTGGTSLAVLRRLPIDTLKVGRSLVSRLGSDPGDTAVVAAVATMARAAGRHALASGVETVDQLAAVTAMGYQSVQGYLSGAPAPLVDLRQVIEAREVMLA